MRRRALFGAGLGVVAGAGLASNVLSSGSRFDRGNDVDLSSLGISYPPKPGWRPPSRDALWARLGAEEYDILVIGGAFIYIYLFIYLFFFIFLFFIFFEF